LGEDFALLKYPDACRFEGAAGGGTVVKQKMGYTWACTAKAPPPSMLMAARPRASPMSASAPGRCSSAIVKSCMCVSFGIATFRFRDLRDLRLLGYRLNPFQGNRIGIAASVDVPLILTSLPRNGKSFGRTSTSGISAEIGGTRVRPRSGGRAASRPGAGLDASVGQRLHDFVEAVDAAAVANVADDRDGGDSLAAGSWANAIPRAKTNAAVHGKIFIKPPDARLTGELQPCFNRY